MRPNFVSFIAIAVFIFTAALAHAANNPTPFVDQPLVPASVAPGGSAFTLTLNGTGFVPGSTVYWNASPRTTTFVSQAQLTAQILASDIATATTASITVVSPAPGASTSNVAFLPVREPASFVSFTSLAFATPSLDDFSIVVGDFNRDGRQDFAIGEIGSNFYEISIFLGKGNGTFEQGAQYTLSYNAYPLLSADVNNDGKLDLVLPSYENANGQSGMAVLLGNGDGTFQPPLASSQPQEQIVLGDFNQDGILDTAAPYNNNPGGYCTAQGIGDGTFASYKCITITNSLYLNEILAGDFNNDGKLDLALSGANSSNEYIIAVALGNGDGTFQPAQISVISSGSSSPAATVDLNGDGKLDLVIYTQPDTLAVLLGNGDGTFGNLSVVNTPPEPYNVIAYDLNGDGKVDLVLTSSEFYATSIYALLGNGDGTFQAGKSFDGGLPGLLGLADFNDDGKLDLAVTNYNDDTYTILTQDNGTVVSLSPTELNFPTQLVGSVSQPRIIALSNDGTAPISVGTINAPANFSQLTNCKTVQPGHSCKIATYFTPTTTGKLQGYLTIADTGGGSPQVVPLSGVATIVSLTPSSLDFGSIAVGRVSGSQNVTLINEGNSSLSITEIGIEGADAKDFSQVNACPSKLMAGARCSISVIFHPSAQGPRTGTLGVEDNGGGSPQKVALSGTGT